MAALTHRSFAPRMGEHKLPYLLTYHSGQCVNNSITPQLVHYVRLTLICCLYLVSVHVLALQVFSVAAPTIWNSLPFDIRNSCSIASFRRKLKTFYFSMSSHV